MTRIETLRNFCKIVRLYVSTQSSGDGITHYRFDHKQVSYTQCEGIVTAKGFKAAEAFAEAYRLGYFQGRKSKRTTHGPLI